ncbi:aminoglycoside phosphotransferase family protein [Kitasatospora sp. MBT63]|uniref:aminoglycoside phosphotransferase family protein n=1 Tax=Kitasatospora sp. MBT63 TaxID=1444768 RepID=UPI000AB49E6C|nr:aminoglycoside phosphotransferase family protein [Kitasatospora sp. MBT63]
MSAAARPNDVDRLLRATAGPYEPVGARSLARTGHPAVWEVVADDGRQLFAKRYKDLLFHQRETAGYWRLAPAIGSGRAPVLTAEDARSLLLVATALPGTPVTGATLTAAEAQEVYRQAGHLAAVIHAQPTTGAPVGEHRSWAAERERTLARARDARPTEEDIEVLADATHTKPPRTGLVYCHGDFGPRNWIVRRDNDGRLVIGVIDFERSQVEEPVRRDLMRIAIQLAPHRGDLGAAFASGYGREFTPQVQEACRAWAAIDCPAALRWALAHHQDEEVLGYARTVLDLLRHPNLFA